MWYFQWIFETVLTVNDTESLCKVIVQRKKFPSKVMEEVGIVDSTKF